VAKVINWRVESKGCGHTPLEFVENAYCYKSKMLNDALLSKNVILLFKVGHFTLFLQLFDFGEGVKFSGGTWKCF